MTVTTAVALKQARLDAISGTNGWGTSATLRIYAGTPPADITVAITGQTLVAQCTPTPASAVAGPPTTKDMLGGVKTVSAGAAGNPVTFYRVVKSDGTTHVEQGTVGTSGADLIIDNTNVANAQTVNFNSFVKTEP